jgi:toxin YoeB
VRYGIKTDRKTAVRTLEIVLDAMRDPFRGIGKPEPLKPPGPGLRSRRLSLGHRVVYLVRDERVDI